jgi:hypothetical protein
VKWAFEAPPAVNPLLAQGHVNCAQGQTGPVWFLAGTFGPGIVDRVCAVPAGISLFFPVGNAFCAGDGFPDGFAAERACATALAPTIHYRAEIDHTPVKGLENGLFDTQYRALSPSFDLVLGTDNIFKAAGIDAPAGVYTPAAADGVYLFLAPLTPGPHTIHIHSELPNGDPIDATYYLTVAP